MQKETAGKKECNILWPKCFHKSFDFAFTVTFVDSASYFYFFSNFPTH